MQCTEDSFVPVEWNSPLLEEDDESTPLAMEVEMDEDSSLLLTSALEKLSNTMGIQCGKFIDDEQGYTEAMTSSFSDSNHWADWSFHTQNTTTLPVHQEDVMFWHRNAGFVNHQPPQTAVQPQPQPQTHVYSTPTSQGHFDMAWTRNCGPRTFDGSYVIHGQAPIGAGGFGVVYSCVPRVSSTNHNNSSRKRRAVKIIPAEHYDRNEIEILQLLHDGPHLVVTLQDIFFGFDRVYLVMEEMKGDLLTRLNEQVIYKETEARTVLHTLFEAVQFLHQRGVAHRDIKPENVLVGNTATDVKLADFGLAKRFRDAQGNRLDPNMFTMCGSVWYAAPEVFGRPNRSEPYDERCDLWSLGVLLYVLLAGYQPFATDCDAATTPDYQIVQEVKRGKFAFHREYWGDISLAAKLLISSLLKVHPVQRCTLREALDSPWIVLPTTLHFLGRN